MITQKAINIQIRTYNGAIQQSMAQQYLTTFSIIAINYTQNEKRYFMSSKSLIRSQMYLCTTSQNHEFENNLFYVQIDGNNREFNVGIQYDQPIILRHKLSHKYLGFSDEEEEEEHDIKYSLKLCDKKYYFKISPCFQYQTKISNKIKFNQECFLGTEIAISKIGYISATYAPQSKAYFKASVGFNFKSKFMFHFYREFQREQKYYHHGQLLWLTHIESSNFISVVNHQGHPLQGNPIQGSNNVNLNSNNINLNSNNINLNSKEELMFQKMKLGNQIQNISGLWMIEGEDITRSGKIKYDQSFRLKNLMTNLYICFSKNYKLVDNQRIYQILLEEMPSDHSKFIFRSILEEESKDFKKGAYLSFIHCESFLYLGCRKDKSNTTFKKIQTFSYFDDEDLFKVNEVNEQEEEALRFIFAIRKQFKSIDKLIENSKKDLSLLLLTDIEETYSNIKDQLAKFKKIDHIFIFVQTQLSPIIDMLCLNTNDYRVFNDLLESHSDSTEKHLNLKQISLNLIKLGYSILNILCENHPTNQVITFKHISTFVGDICKFIGAQELLIEIFRNNKHLLCKIPQPIPELKQTNLIRAVLMEFKRKSKDKDHKYWINIMKILSFLQVVLYHEGNPIDINQKTISEQLFERNLFEIIFFPLKIVGQKIQVFSSQANKLICIEQIKEKNLNEILQKVFTLLSNICSNRNLISKNNIYKYFSSHSQTCITVFISYLNKSPIRKELYNSMLKFVSNAFIDSSPRLQRIRPLSVIFFIFQPDQSNPSIEEQYFTHQLNQVMILKAQESKVCKPLQFSNLLRWNNQIISIEPSMTEDQLVLCRLDLTQKLLANRWSVQLLEAICLMMKLESYTINQVIQIYQELCQNITLRHLPHQIISQIIKILEEVNLLAIELEIKKLTTFLKYKFTQSHQKQINNNELQFVLPGSLRISLLNHNQVIKSQSAKKESNHKESLLNHKESLLNHKESLLNHKEYIDMTTNMNNKNFIGQFNELRDTLEFLHGSREMKSALIWMICLSQMNESELAGVFSFTLKCCLPKTTFLQSLMGSIIMTHEEGGMFQSLFEMSKKIQHLISISECWFTIEEEQSSSQTYFDIGSQTQGQNSKMFVKLLGELTNFMFDDYELNSENNSIRKNGKLNINKQLLLGSMNIHIFVFQLVQKNAFIIEKHKTKKELKKKIKDVLELCFKFLETLISGCTQNKKLIYDYLPILIKYQNYIELGQIQTISQFYKNQKAYIKEMQIQFLQSIIYKIIKNEHLKSNETAEFNPLYINLFIMLIHNLGKQSKSFIEKIYQIIGKEALFKKILFTQDINQETILCLKMFKIKIEPLQVPIIYHAKVLQFFHLITTSTETIRTNLRLKLNQIVKLNQALQFLLENDIFSAFGIQPQLNFLLKRQLLKLIIFYIQKSEFHGQLYENETLLAVLHFYRRIFLTRIEKKEITAESQSLYLPYLEEHQDQFKLLLHNKFLFYTSDVKPFLSKLLLIFQKLNKNQNNQIKNTLISLVDDLENAAIKEEISQTQKVYGLDDIQLKWRNFVDDDQDNSQEEKYAKKTVLEILKSEHTAKIINQELSEFYDELKKNTKQFIKSIVKMLKMLFERKNIENGREGQNKVMQNALLHLKGFILHLKTEEEIKLAKSTLEEMKFIEIVIKLMIRQQFQLTKIHMKTIFSYCLKIFIFMLAKDDEFKICKIFYKIFEENMLSYKFLNLVKDGALSIIERIDSTNFVQQINSALSQMYLCVQRGSIFLEQDCFSLLTSLCNYSPFTRYLRQQQNDYIEVDFLDKIYNILSFIFYQQYNEITINVSVVKAAEHILDFICSMFTNANSTNQNFIIDSKFPQFVNSILKIETLKVKNNVQSQQRKELLIKVVQFYESNGIDIKQLLSDKISLIDFDQPYLLCRLKYMLIRTLTECTIANETSFAKLRLRIPLEIIKLNLMWVYQSYQKGKYSYEEKYILKPREDWNAVVKYFSKNIFHPQNNFKSHKSIHTYTHLFLRSGFYLYSLIQSFNTLEKEEEVPEADEQAPDQNKQKERIVKKFFLAISDDKRRKKKQKWLQNEAMGEEMTQYFHQYYNALIFFRKHSATIQINLNEQIMRVYFPILPIAQRITQDMKSKFKKQVERVSRDEKLKSLISFQQQFYQDIHGEDKYFDEMQEKAPFLGPILRMMKYQSQFLLIAWVLSVIIVILYMMENYVSPSFNFTADFIQYIVPSTVLRSILLALTIFNVLFGVTNGIYLFSRKIPLMRKLLITKYKTSKEKKKEHVGFTYSEFAYVWSRIAKESFYNFYIMFFLLMTAIHPFFAGFILIEIVNRIEIGKFIITSIKQTWFQLLTAAGLLYVSNFLFSQIFYVFFSQTQAGYAPTCLNLYHCLLLLIDQSLKAGTGVMGNTAGYYKYMTLNFQFLIEIIYVIFGQQVIFEIFSGTIIDKFSELREKEEEIEKDESTLCYICAQERFNIDLDLEGFQEHTQINHNPLNYIAYLFYLRRSPKKDFGIQEKYVSQQMLKRNTNWIPEETSISKVNNQRKEAKQDQEEDFKIKNQAYCNTKVKQLKKIKQKVEGIYLQIKSSDNELMKE